MFQLTSNSLAIAIIATAVNALASAIVYLSSNTVAHAQTNQELDDIALYLPVNSNVYPDLAQQLQQALASESVTGVRIKHTDFWHPYQYGLRKGHRGVYFAQPHFAAWAITKHNFEPLYKLHGKLEYVLTTDRSNASIFELNDLTGKVICREAGLNLGTVWLNKLLSEYQITATSKELSSVEVTMRNDPHSCNAFIIDNNSYERINNKKLGQYIRLAQSASYKHNAFIAHPDLPPKLIRKFKKALKSKAVKQALSAYFTSLSKWQTLHTINQNDYDTSDIQLLMPYWGKD